MSMNKTLSVYDVTKNLIGPIIPTGEHNEDQKRLDNIKMLIQLIDGFLSDLGVVTPAVDRIEASMAAIGKEACDYLNDLRKSL